MIAAERLGRSLLVATTTFVAVALGASTAFAADPQADQGASAPAPGTAPDPRPAHYEFGFVSVGAYQTWAIAGDWLYFGAGGGLGPPLFRYSKIGDRDPDWDTSLQVAYANAFLRVQPVPYVDIDLGPKIAITSELYQGPDPPQSAFAYGGVLDLRVGTKTIKVGPRFEYERVAYFNYYENAWRITPLMLRVYH